APLQPRSTLFPYTTLFRSGLLRPDRKSPVQGRCARSSREARVKRVRWLRTTERTGARLASPPSRPEPRSTDFVRPPPGPERPARSEEHTSELQSRVDLVCR